MAKQLIGLYLLGAFFASCALGLPHGIHYDESEIPVCNGDELLPHQDCTKYYQCVNGIPTERLCAGSTYFNPEIGQCDHQANVPECVGGTRPPIGDPPTTPLPTTEAPEPPTTLAPEPPTTEAPEPPTTEAPEPPTTEAPEPPTTEAPEPPTTEAPEPPTTEAPEPPTTEAPEPPTTEAPELSTVEPPLCHPAGYYTLPIPGNCTAFIICAYGNQYIDVCAEGLKFDPVIRKCLLEELVDCEDATPPPEPTTEPPTTTEAPLCPLPGYYLKSYPGSCTLYYACTDHIATLLECGWGLEFDPVLLTCVREEHSTCALPTTPPQPTDEPETEEPVQPTTTEEPVEPTDEPQTEEPETEEPVQPTTEEPVEPTDEPQTEEPETEEPVEPTTEEPVEPTDSPTTTTTTKRPGPRCEPDGYYYIPYEDDTTCVYYIHCNFGIPILLQCAEGTLFNPGEQKCVREETYVCPFTPTRPPPTTEAPVEPTTEAPEPTTVEPPQPTTEAEEPTTEAPPVPTNPPPVPTTEEPPEATTIRFPCPNDPFIYLPHYEKCSLFYLCMNGEFRGVFSCGTNHWFDSVFQGCVTPENSDCRLEPLP